MYLIVVGAGAQGDRLADVAVQNGHDVLIIERDEAAAEAASRAHDARVLHASITDPGIADEASMARADVLIATTGDDAANLMAAFIAREAGVERVISIVNEPDHEQLFARLDAETLVDPELIIAEHLYSRISQAKFIDAMPLPDGAQAYFVEIHDGSPLVGKDIARAVEDGVIPGDCVVVAIRRSDQLVIPAGDTEIGIDDRVSLVSATPLSRRDLAMLRGRE